MMQNKFLNNRSFLRQLASGVHYTATSPGPYRLLFIAIHGNESCGVEAYLKISSKIPNLLQDGSLEVRLGNPVAFLLNQRSFNKDLNRCFTVSDIPQYETKRCKTLINSLQKADLFLDIHSTSAPGPSFLLPSKNGHSLCQQLPVNLVIHGLAQKCTGTTLTVVDEINTEGTVVECGQHADESAVAVAIECITNFIQSQTSNRKKITAKNQTVLQCPSSVVADEGFQFVKPISFMQKFVRNQLIARSSHKEFRCPYSEAFVIMPNVNPQPGEEAFYWGIQ